MEAVNYLDTVFDGSIQPESNSDSTIMRWGFKSFQTDKLPNIAYSRMAEDLEVGTIFINDNDEQYIYAGKGLLREEETSFTDILVPYNGLEGYDTADYLNMLRDLTSQVWGSGVFTDLCEQYNLPAAIKLDNADLFGYRNTGKKVNDNLILRIRQIGYLNVIFNIEPDMLAQVNVLDAEKLKCCEEALERLGVRVDTNSLITVITAFYPKEWINGMGSEFWSEKYGLVERLIVSELNLRITEAYYDKESLEDEVLVEALDVLFCIKNNENSELIAVKREIPVGDSWEEAIYYKPRWTTMQIAYEGKLVLRENNSLI